MKELELNYLKKRISELKKRQSKVKVDIRDHLCSIKKLRQYISVDKQLKGHCSYYSYLCNSLVDERKLLKLYSEESRNIKKEIKILNRLLNVLLDTIKGYNRDKPSHFGYFERIYHRGINPHWQVGDKLAYNDSSLGREYDLGTIIKIELNNKKLDDWVYTFDDVCKKVK